MSNGWKGKFDALNKLGQAKDATAELGSEKTTALLSEINLLLKLLQDAGYEIAQLEIGLGLTPTVAVQLGIGSSVSADKLDAILQAHQEKPVIATTLATLIQANKLRDSITIESLAAMAVKIVLGVTPHVTLQWKGKGTTI